MTIGFRVTSAVASGAICLVLLTGCFSLQEYGDSQDEPTTNCTVDGKERVDLGGDEGSEYRVYSSCGVFKVVDDPLKGHWNSADTYNSIKEGKTYDFKAYGIRNGLLSEFPNILEATEVSGS